MDGRDVGPHLAWQGIEHRLGEHNSFGDERLIGTEGHSMSTHDLIDRQVIHEKLDVAPDDCTCHGLRGCFYVRCLNRLPLGRGERRIPTPSCL